MLSVILLFKVTHTGQHCKLERSESRVRWPIVANPWTGAALCNESEVLDTVQEARIMSGRTCKTGVSRRSCQLPPVSGLVIAGADDCL